ncbi:MAG: hydrogenase nickel incorporation protein HypB [Gammaproteobacteria bacterium]|nr:hydrogenase nickel incorporation protein HypB [Gammaproteobacteria bacterium]
MCGICGCNDQESALHDHGKESLDHKHSHAHSHDSHEENRLFLIEQDILSKNNKFAEDNRRYFSGQKILALNLLSSPGSGKTTLLEKTIPALKNQFNIAVIEGDQQTDCDAERIKATGVPVVQINTGKGCHLDAHQVGHATQKLTVEDKTILFIENVGNLVCPSLFDLGESQKIVILSVTEGVDKPLKYPDMFYVANLMIINKIDLLEYVDFNVEKCIEYAHRINPDLQVITLSATKNKGLENWYEWLMNEHKKLFSVHHHSTAF